MRTSREAIKAMALMRRLLTNAQTKFRKMVDDNKQSTKRIDGDIAQEAPDVANNVRSELLLSMQDGTCSDSTTATGSSQSGSLDDDSRSACQVVAAAAVVASSHDTSRIPDPDPPLYLPSCIPHPACPSPPALNTAISMPATVFCARCSQRLEDPEVLHVVNKIDEHDAEEMARLREENERLSERNRHLQREMDDIRSLNETELTPKMKQLEGDLHRSAEAMAALKADRKRLKAEKFDLLSQMKQLYGTLEDKEKELRDFIRNYEQRMKEGGGDHHHQQHQQQQLASADRSPSFGPIKAEDSKQRYIRLHRIMPLDDTFESSSSATTRSSSFCVVGRTVETETESLVRQLQDEVTDQPYGQSSPVGLPDGYSVGGGSGSSSKVNGFHTLPAAASSTMLSSPNDPHVSRSKLDVSKMSPSPPIVVDAATAAAIDAANPIYVNTPSPMGVGSMSTLDVCQSTSLSRSAEELTNMLGTLDLKRKSGTLQRRVNGHESGAGKGGTWGSISKVFSRGRSRRSMDPSLVEFDKRTSWSPQNSLCASPLTEETYSEKLRLLDEARVLPMDAWRAPMVQAWLELSMGMYQYGPACAENIKSGKVLLELNDAELEAGLRMSNPMHRRKLRLAIEEFREPTSCKYPKASELSHVWVCNEWLPGLGLAQYVDAFALHLVDARVLDHINKKDMEKYLGVTRKFHQTSLAHAIQLLRMVGFDQQTLSERRSMCEQTDGDPLVWTNQRYIQWARSVDLGEYAENLRNSGVHGAIVVLEPSFSSDTMATALGIPQSKNIIRRHLTTELESIIHPARVLLEQEYFHDRQLTKKDKYSIGSLGRNFSQSYAGGLPGSDARRSSLRGSLTRAFGLKVKQDLQQQQQQHRHAYSSASSAAHSSHHLARNNSATASNSSAACQHKHQQQHAVAKTQQRPRSSQIPTRSRGVPPSRVSSAPPLVGTSSSSSSSTTCSASIPCGASASSALLLAAPTAVGSSSRSTPTGHRSTSSTTSSSPSAAAAAAYSSDASSHRRIKSSGDVEITVTTAVTSV